jgi:tetratricopeptide (TPR) repeat protein
LQPGDGRTDFHIGLTLRFLGNYPDAIDAFREAIRLAPQVDNAYLGVGEALLEMGKPGDAIPYLENAARLAQPNNSRARILLEKARMNR